MTGDLNDQRRRGVEMEEVVLRGGQRGGDQGSAERAGDTEGGESIDLAVGIKRPTWFTMCVTSPGCRGVLSSVSPHSEEESRRASSAAITPPH